LANIVLVGEGAADVLTVSRDVHVVVDGAGCHHGDAVVVEAGEHGPQAVVPVRFEQIEVGVCIIVQQLLCLPDDGGCRSEVYVVRGQRFGQWGGVDVLKPDWRMGMRVLQSLDLPRKVGTGELVLGEGLPNG
jgi:hypothetical protein